MTTDFDLPLFATPDQIRRREFVATRRGYDPDQVRAYLEQLADQIAQLEARVAEERKKAEVDRKSTRLNSSHSQQSRMPSSA